MRALFVFFVVSTSLCLHAQMRLCEYLPEYVPVTISKVDDLAYKALKSRPLAKPVTFLVAPWNYFIHGKPCKPTAAQRAKPRKFKKETKEEVVFTISSTPRHKEMLAEFRRLGVTHLFTCNPSGGSLQGIRVLPILHAPRNVTEPAKHRDILYSFIGCWHKRVQVRKELAKLPKCADVLIKFRKEWNAKGDNALEYMDVNARSRFGLCPRGTFPNTIRMPELMKSGTIPVILADGIRLPKCIDWKKCCVFVRERDVLKVDKIIRNIPIDVEESMRQECLRISAMLEDDPAYFIRHYFEHEWDSDRGV